MKRYFGIYPDGTTVIVVSPYSFRKEIRERYVVPEEFIDTLNTGRFPKLDVVRNWPGGWTPESRDEDAALCERLGVVLGPRIPPVPENPFKDNRS